MTDASERLCQVYDEPRAMRCQSNVCDADGSCLHCGAASGQACLSSQTGVAGRGPGMQNNTSQPAPTVGREEVESALTALYHAGMRIGARTSRDLAADDIDAALPRCMDTIFSPTERADPGAGEPAVWGLYNPNTENWLKLTFPTKAAATDHASRLSDNYRLVEARPLYATTPSPASTSSQQPAPGAPEGWREATLAYFSAHAAINEATRYGRDPGPEAYETCDRAAETLRNLAALTSSSATGGEEDEEAPGRAISYLWKRVRALAQTNRRLREGLDCVRLSDDGMSITIMLPDSGGFYTWSASAGSEIAPKIASGFRQIAAALKDNGHG